MDEFIYDINIYNNAPENYDFIIKKLYGYVPSDIHHKLLLMNTDEFREMDTKFLDGEFDDEWERYWDTKCEILEAFLERMPTIHN